MNRDGFNLIRSVARLALGRRLPTLDGDLQVRGLQGELRIHRDDHGVPYIWADNDHDAWFGLGFCHGQDRAGQLEIALRMVRGTLSAVAGEDTVALDRLSRRLGLRRAGEAQIKVQDADIQRQIEAYARGINAAHVGGAAKNAPEFVLLGCQPTPWEAADVQGLVVLVCFALASNWDIELMRLSAIAKDGPEALMALDASYPAWLPSAMSPLADARGPGGLKLGFEALGEEVRKFGEVFGMIGGSNAWAVSADKSATGRPILANDPHMLPAAPSQWYLSSIRTPEWGCVGGSFVGVPGQCAGHNGHAAWGVTAAHVDHTDLFLEQLGPDGHSVRRGDVFEACPVLQEIIEVKGGREVIEEVVVTPRGPIFSPAVDDCPVALSIAGTWLAPRPNRGLLAIHRARTADDFREVFRKAAGSNAGLVFVAEDGTVGSQISAEVPIRRGGLGRRLPAPGWDDRFGWDGLVAPEDMPRYLAPPNGIVAMANAQPSVPTEMPEDLGNDWLDGFRLARIIEALEAHDAWTVDGMLALQRDHRTLAWPPLGRVVRDLQSEDPFVIRAQHMLADWDGDVAPSSVAATLYEFWVAELVARVVRAKAPRAGDELLGKGTTAFLPYNLILTRRVGHLIELLHDQPEGWFGPERTWDAVLEDCLGTALKTLETRLGPPGQAWQWGRVRTLTLKHPFSEKAPMDRLFDIGPVWCGGDATTIPQAGVDLRDPTANPTGVATMRVVIDVGAWDNSRYVLLGGQSGIPFSEHYEDHVPLWERGAGIPIYWSREKAEKAAKHRLTLRPA